MLGSQTQKVLQHTTIPVLVSAVESNLPRRRDRWRRSRSSATSTARLPRSSTASNTWSAQARDSGTPPSFPLLRAMLHYIKAFPEKLHHPKEDAYLFRKLRARTHEFDATLDELERQHVEGHALVEELERSIVAYEADPARRTRRASRQAVERFATSQIAAHGARSQGDHPGGARRT